MQDVSYPYDTLLSPGYMKQIEGLDKKEKKLFYKLDMVYSLPFLRRFKDMNKTENHSLLSFVDNDFYELKVKHNIFTTKIRD